MPSFLYRVGYTAQAWATQVKNPQNRVEAIRPIVEKLGGKIVSTYYAFGEDDIVLICDMPDNQAAASFAIAAAAGGALSHVRTTPLMTVEEGLAAIRAAGQSGYRPPS